MTAQLNICKWMGRVVSRTLAQQAFRLSPPLKKRNTNFFIKCTNRGGQLRTYGSLKSDIKRVKKTCISQNSSDTQYVNVKPSA